MQTYRGRWPGLIVVAAALAQAVSAQCASAAAKDYPSRPIRVVIPYAAGGGPDVVGRIIAHKLTPSLGQNIVFENRGGAGSAIGNELVAKSAPDGYTLLLNSSSYASLPFFVKSLAYDPVRDLLPVTMLARNVGHLLIVNPSLPARSVKEFIALAKAHPGKLNYGTAGTGNVMHLAAELFDNMAGVRMTHVPYTGTPAALADVISGQIEVAFPSAPSVLPFIQSGRLRALAITAEKRWHRLPDLPTLGESGVKGYRFVVWYGLWFPAGTPAEYVARIQNEVAKALADPDTRQRLAEQGLDAVGSKPDEFEKSIQEEMARNKKLTEAMGVVKQ